MSHVAWAVRCARVKTRQVNGAISIAKARYTRMYAAKHGVLYSATYFASRVSPRWRPYDSSKTKQTFCVCLCV